MRPNLALLQRVRGGKLHRLGHLHDKGIRCFIRRARGDQPGGQNKILIRGYDVLIERIRLRDGRTHGEDRFVLQLNNRLGRGQTARGRRRTFIIPPDHDIKRIGPGFAHRGRRGHGPLHLLILAVGDASGLLIDLVFRIGEHQLGGDFVLHHPAGGDRQSHLKALIGGYQVILGAGRRGDAGNARGDGARFDGQNRKRAVGEADDIRLLTGVFIHRNRGHADLDLLGLHTRL
ncbi:MAG: hypothetical protein BWY83_01981 [bacterium ADurb.Bin478]|nr:MAG: hypothetical protein BWY83_01981 [bacterium ADurb.Bin478]